MSDYDYDGDTGRAFINGQWIIVNDQAAEEFAEQTAWYRLEGSLNLQRKSFYCNECGDVFACASPPLDNLCSFCRYKVNRGSDSQP